MGETRQGAKAKRDYPKEAFVSAAEMVDKPFTLARVRTGRSPYGPSFYLAFAHPATKDPSVLGVLKSSVMGQQIEAEPLVEGADYVIHDSPTPNGYTCHVLFRVTADAKSASTDAKA